MLWPLGHYDYEVHKRHLKIESSPTAHDDIFSVIRQNALSFYHLILSTALFFLITTHTYDGLLCKSFPDALQYF